MIPARQEKSLFGVHSESSDWLKGFTWIYEKPLFFPPKVEGSRKTFAQDLGLILCDLGIRPVPSVQHAIDAGVSGDPDFLRHLVGDQAILPVISGGNLPGRFRKKRTTF